MAEKEKYPVSAKEIEKFLKSNPKIKDALDLFEISQEQYSKALQSLQPEATTSTKNVIEIEA